MRTIYLLTENDDPFEALEDEAGTVFDDLSIMEQILRDYKTSLPAEQFKRLRTFRMEVYPIAIG